MTALFPQGEAVSGSPKPDTAMISVVVPTLNEEDNIVLCLQQVRESGGAIELIVVDGGSTDQTRLLAVSLADKVVHCERGRGVQLNHGAALARGDVLLFLHADTLLPLEYDTEIRTALGRGFAAGAFRLQINSPHPGLKLVAWLANLRSAWRDLPYGDQALFVRKDLFQAMQGFCPLPLMEDLEFVRRLRTRTPLYLSRSCVRTSARRWERKGILRTTLLNQLYRLAYALGCSPHILARHYYRRQAACKIIDDTKEKQ